MTEVPSQNAIPAKRVARAAVGCVKGGNNHDYDPKQSWKLDTSSQNVLLGWAYYQCGHKVY